MKNSNDTIWNRTKISSINPLKLSGSYMYVLFSVTFQISPFQYTVDLHFTRFQNQTQVTILNRTG